MLVLKKTKHSTPMFGR